ncbi:MAG: protein TolR [Candidatus Tectomicrobia bacterium]|nr:protein TolR [Candidatus Tectomicrobia bacterium]
MANSLHSSGSSMAEINVTPLVDVMLVLLIIFMVTAPMLQQGIDVQLPKEGGKELALDKQFVVTVGPDGRIFFNEQRLSLQKFEATLRAMPEQQKQREIFLRADTSVSYGAVMKIIAAIKRAGFERLGMVTEPTS